MLTLTESGKQFAVTGYFYVSPFADSSPSKTYSVKGIYSPAKRKLSARVIFNNQDGTKTEVPLTADYDPGKDEFNLEIDSRVMVPTDQTSFDDVLRKSGSIAKLSCGWSHGDKLALTTDAETQGGVTGEEDNRAGTQTASTLRIKIVATMSCNVEDSRSDPSGGTLVKLNNRPVITGGDGTITIETSPGTYNVKTFADNTVAGSMIFRVSKTGAGGKYMAASREGDYSVTFSGSDKNPSSSAPDYVLAFRMGYCAR